MDKLSFRCYVSQLKLLKPPISPGTRRAHWSSLHNPTVGVPFRKCFAWALRSKARKQSSGASQHGPFLFLSWANLVRMLHLSCCWKPLHWVCPLKAIKHTSVLTRHCRSSTKQACKFGQSWLENTSVNVCFALFTLWTRAALAEHLGCAFLFILKGIKSFQISFSQVWIGHSGGKEAWESDIAWKAK